MKPYAPLVCESKASEIGHLVQVVRIETNVRQIDLAQRVGISLRKVRFLEAGQLQSVSALELMAVLFELGILERVFTDLMSDPAFVSSYMEHSAAGRRVRLPKVGEF